ncbi:malate dehydrogenase (oxaloacetate-decarboxylating)(NADP+) [Desulfacinum hydrothermale DSM 13146]|uniref:Malate dehydrogenase (Oxaloacetate-decarboxylating)(NADP+) n=1 Tax=Desulfacinum hydrothermale DSM 13146 TaxID=1121390 RepID=A0A1W1XBR0_9BACT|nr:NAD-dependent malic enzyme [Desulfacinum hydrothermale]SMC21317.1 malate dehydrogenase (oxaloacetate-decarboxylating)(NADP+) [Desulfacinum hydrothermale DSM 13146]
MYQIEYDGDHMVIRCPRRLVGDTSLSRFLGDIVLQSLMENAQSAETASRMARQKRLDEIPKGIALLRNPDFNKGTAFTEEEKDALGIRGLVPPRVHTIQEQIRRVLENLRRKPNNLEKYIFLTGLQDRNKTLFYRVLLDNIEELLPIVYTPTVGQACQEYGHIFRRPRGIYISPHDRGRVVKVLRNWPHKNVRIIVVTDGERILGLGDLGADGMGIPVGKLALYTACAGIHHSQSLPVALDVGTDNEALRDDPLYIGVRRPRLRGPEYDALVEEFVMAVQHVFPGALIQFEDFANRNAFRLLQRYRNRVCCFNDDIQGTAAVALAGLYGALRLTGGRLQDQRILFMGAGEAGLGAGELVVSAMTAEGLDPQEARSRCWFMDSKGLIVQARDDLNEHKRVFAHPHPFVADLASAVETLRPTALIGVSGVAGLFNEGVLRTMARINDRPIVFALSNPTSNAECTAREAYEATDGRVIFASGSPFEPFTYKGRTVRTGQGNNIYIFPGVGLGVIASGARHVTDEMFFVAAKSLAQMVLPEDLQEGMIFPRLTRIREVSLKIAQAVAYVAYRSALATVDPPEDLEAYIQSLAYVPEYESYV